MAEERVAVITGASGGIGEALARELGGRGFRLALAARRPDELRRVAREAEERGAPGALDVQTDVTQREDVERLRDATLDRFGRIDVWVNNAGRGISRSVLDLTDDDVDQIVAVNVRSVLYGIQAIAPYFIERGTGHIINVSSFLGRVPLVPMRSMYNAAKAAVNALTANLRMELRTRAPGVHVSLVMPGVVTTDFPRNVIGAAPGAGERPGGPPGAPATPTAPRTQTPEEVASRMADLIEHPRAELFTNPAQPDIARRYYQDIAAFEDEWAGRQAR
ncbi:MAG TPA: SDR family oxidoreductase [Longimicrobiales bacterium]|nr:SDR family oxidoreductase [Longimicrobiales bacterium]